MTRNIVAGLILKVVFGLMFAVGGYFLLVYLGFPTLRNANESKDWPTVDGKITGSRVARSESDGTTMYRAEVKYTYAVDGQPQIGNKVWFGDDVSTSSPGSSQETVKTYTVGKKVKVYVKPGAPTVAVLEPGAFLTSYFMVIGGGGGILVGGWLLLGPVFRLVVLAIALGFAGAKRGGGNTTTR